ncbi:MarR family winged helix-turn-helix transcriptional regulator [Yoonia sp. MH D7]
MVRKSRNFHYLLHAADLVEQHLRQQLAPLGIGPRQARILDAIAMLEPVSQVRLARAFSVTPASISTMTGRLLTAGLIARETNPDQPKSNLVRLTDLGREHISRINDIWSEIDAMIVAKIGEAETEILTRVTHKLRNEMGGVSPRDS